MLPTRGRTVDLNSLIEDLSMVDLDELTRRLDQLDAEIIDRIESRVDLARRIAAVRQQRGASRYSHQHDMLAVQGYGRLGAAGREIAPILLRLSR